MASQDPKFEEKQPCFNSVLIQCLFLWTWEQHRQYVISSRTWPVFENYTMTRQAAEENLTKEESWKQGADWGWGCIRQKGTTACLCLCCLFLFPSAGRSPPFLPWACACVSLPHFTKWSWKSSHEPPWAETVKITREKLFSCLRQWSIKFPCC